MHTIQLGFPLQDTGKIVEHDKVHNACPGEQGDQVGEEERPDNWWQVHEQFNESVHQLVLGGAVELGGVLEEKHLEHIVRVDEDNCGIGGQHVYQRVENDKVSEPLHPGRV